MSKRWVNGELVDVMSTRACWYGDGLFETLHVQQGRVLFWWHHWQRLQLGLRRLAYPAVSETQVWSALQPALHAAYTGVLRLTVTRQGGARGYASHTAQTLVFEVLAAPLPEQVWHGQAITARWCQTTWAQQPLLAGIKHLNRLEQVLARSEWQDSHFAEGLVCDTQGNVISGTMSALAVRLGKTVLFADVQQVGIDSVARQQIAPVLPSLGYEVLYQSIGKQDVALADELLLMNVVQGIARIHHLEGAPYADDHLLKALTPIWTQWVSEHETSIQGTD